MRAGPLSVLEELNNEVSLTYGAWKIERIRHLVLVAIDRERASGEPDSSAVMQDDMAALMEALGMSSHARPSSPHRVMRDEIIPRARQLVAGGEPVAFAPLKKDGSLKTGTQPREVEPSRGGNSPRAASSAPATLGGELEALETELVSRLPNLATLIRNVFARHRAATLGAAQPIRDLSHEIGFNDGMDDDEPAATLGAAQPELPGGVVEALRRVAVQLQHLSIDQLSGREHERPALLQALAADIFAVIGPISASSAAQPEPDDEPLQFDYTFTVGKVEWAVTLPPGEYDAWAREEHAKALGEQPTGVKAGTSRPAPEVGAPTGAVDPTLAEAQQDPGGAAGAER